MSSEVLVRAEGVSKKFCRSLKRSLRYGLVDMAREAIPFRRNGNHAANGNPTLREDEFWAVNDVSFELRRGECLGLIGRNGAGKTTLLKILNGLIKPDKGRIEMRGRVGALIALGAGFNPILTGRENVYVNGSVLGLTKAEMDAKLDEIIDFADIREFIDAPVQSYSSGMQVRLGFAVATALQPDILLLDEVLAVGDATFRAKCYNRIGKLQKNAAVIFVSHAMDQVARVCSSGLHMERGRSTGKVEVALAIKAYDQDGNSGEAASFCEVHHPVERARVRLHDSQIGWGHDMTLSIDLTCTEPIPTPHVYGVFYDQAGSMVASWDLSVETVKRQIDVGESTLTFSIHDIKLADGKYWIGLVLGARGNIAHLVWSYKESTFSVKNAPPGLSTYRLAGNVSVLV